MDKRHPEGRARTRQKQVVRTSRIRLTGAFRVHGTASPAVADAEVSRYQSQACRDPVRGNRGNMLGKRHLRWRGSTQHQPSLGGPAHQSLSRCPAPCCVLHLSSSECGIRNWCDLAPDALERDLGGRSEGRATWPRCHSGYPELGCGASMGRRSRRSWSVDSDSPKGGDGERCLSKSSRQV